MIKYLQTSIELLNLACIISLILLFNKNRLRNGMQNYDSMGRINTQAPLQSVSTTVNDNVCISEHLPESMLNAFSTRTW